MIKQKKLTIVGNWFYPDLFLSLFPIITGVVLYNETAHSTEEHIQLGLFCSGGNRLHKSLFPNCNRYYRRNSSILPWNMSSQVVLLDGIN